MRTFVRNAEREGIVSAANLLLINRQFPKSMNTPYVKNRLSNRACRENSKIKQYSAKLFFYMCGNALT